MLESPSRAAALLLITTGREVLSDGGGPWERSGGVVGFRRAGRTVRISGVVDDGRKV